MVSFSRDRSTVKRYRAALDLLRMGLGHRITDDLRRMSLIGWADSQHLSWSWTN
jgi:hypothetical protein